ncbi:unnamed protein product [Soboliphyme baturini]|uniref:Uncharacterized protein n=1 Tax=Soboliphyme baturini TaxID=241478 RepID=A0A183IL60_9BILA|nr:unnamed protein product [Soboliphyme baturini]
MIGGSDDDRVRIRREWDKDVLFVRVETRDDASPSARGDHRRRGSLDREATRHPAPFPVTSSAESCFQLINSGRNAVDDSSKTNNFPPSSAAAKRSSPIHVHGRRRAGAAEPLFNVVDHSVRSSSPSSQVAAASDASLSRSWQQPRSAGHFFYNVPLDTVPGPQSKLPPKRPPKKQHPLPSKGIVPTSPARASRGVSHRPPQSAPQSSTTPAKQDFTAFLSTFATASTKTGEEGHSMSHASLRTFSPAALEVINQALCFFRHVITPTAKNLKCIYHIYRSRFVTVAFS